MTGTPGSHGQNWRPATTIDDYARNCREGLEEFSQRHAAKLLGWSRMQMWRCMLIGTLPKPLFELLLAQDEVPSIKELATVAMALRGKLNADDVERCRHCGEILRVRRRLSAVTMAAVNDWLAEQQRDVGQRQ